MKLCQLIVAVRFFGTHQCTCKMARFGFPLSSHRLENLLGAGHTWDVLLRPHTRTIRALLQYPNLANINLFTKSPVHTGEKVDSWIQHGRPRRFGRICWQNLNQNRQQSWTYTATVDFVAGFGLGNSRLSTKSTVLNSTLLSECTGLKDSHVDDNWSHVRVL